MGILADGHDPDEMPHNCCISSGSALFAKAKSTIRERNSNNNL